MSESLELQQVVMWTVSESESKDGRGIEIDERRAGAVSCEAAAWESERDIRRDARGLMEPAGSEGAVPSLRETPEAACCFMPTAEPVLLCSCESVARRGGGTSMLLAD
jgi:hypothetical protein